MFKKHNLIIFQCNFNDLNFHLLKFLGEINLKKMQKIKGIIKRLIKLIKAFKNSCSDKIKRIKTICQKHFTKLQKMKKHKIKDKTYKKWKTIWNNVLFLVQRLYEEF